MEQLIDFHAPEVQAVLDTLLKDRSTGKNIIWATDPPEELQTVMYEPVTDKSQITAQQLGLTHYKVVLPRMMKQTDTQQQRTRKKGEVFSPAWVCNKMNNALDADWFRGLGAEESAGQFTVELPQGWQTVETPVQFPVCKGRTPAWVQYVQSRRLEATCGEAPFLASRYDAATGEMIPVARRIGILDRKLRVVSENAATEEEWRKYATHAVQSTYGYEYQGDNLLLARVNLLLTYAEHLQARWQRKPTKEELQPIAKIISWNLWQMDGLHLSVPGGKPQPEAEQLDLFSMFGATEEQPPTVSCKVKNWRKGSHGTAQNFETNPYANLPMLNLYTYQMSEIIRDEIQQGVEIDGETQEFAFDLNEFFKVKPSGSFEHEAEVDRFLDAMTTQNKFPFSTPELRAELKHTFWLLNRVDSARALAKKLQAHPVFRDYEVILAAGDGKLDDTDENQKSFDRVKAAIAHHEKTITLSVGQLTTGVTIPEWSAVLMLSNLKSPALYMQAAFRAQNPCLFHENGTFRRKENAYVFDFDPARTLLIYEQFANDLSQDTASGKGDTEERKAHIQNLLNFFPVIGEDEEGEMIPLDAEKVLSIPRKIKSKEVARMGFQSNFLFQNISNVFSAPQEVLDILQNFQPISEAKAKPIQITPETGADLSLNDKGEVDLDEGYVIGKAADVFGAKIYESTPALDTALQDLTDASAPAKEEHLEPLKKSITKEIITPMVEQAKQEYGRDLKLSDQKRFESAAKAKMDVAVNKVVDNYRIDQSQLETQRTQQLQSCTTAQQRQQVNREFDAKQQQSTAALMENLQSTIQQTAQEMQQTIVRTVETNQKEQEKKGYEDTVRDHLRGFSRTIPSFLMAYGDETVTLANFDQIIPDKVFQEVTSITLEQFRFLRDGGPYINQTTGQEEHFAGHLFDPVVFDDSVKEFLNLKVKLADYFDESRTEDIFDYIPPQKTNQIFTPKWVVKKMVDLLEQENPGCLDDPGKTFLDPYMKSGLYITEIVKHLYRSEKMRQAFPDDNARLEHIFAKQVYGLAPTEIIYRIAISYILGFAKGHGITAHHIRQADTLEFAKAGTMERELDKIFRD